MKNIDISSLPISKVVFFNLKDKKYLASNGVEITTEMLFKYKHVIFDGFGFIIIQQGKTNKVWD